jgi:exopolysaccharide production protein ExoQ
MAFKIAFLIFAIGVGFLFHLDRDKSIRTSKALWLPVIWLWIIGSRPASAWLWVWFGIGGGTGGGLDAQLDGSPVDAVIFLLLLLAAIGVLLRRKSKVRAYLKSSYPVLLYYGYCLASCLWSPFPEVACKRWLKAVGDLVMVLVVLTDPQPMEALRRVSARVGFILMPASLLLIRYSTIGRGFDEDGNPSNLGVTTNKNTLGLITWVMCLASIWSFRSLYIARKQPNRNKRLVAHGALVLSGLAVLVLAHSATSVSCTVLGTGLLFLSGLSWVRQQPRRLNTVVLGLAALTSVGMVFDLKGAILHALGRKPDLTGRTVIWQRIIPMARNPIIGAGFESFWNASAPILHRIKGPEGRMFQNLNTSHNGYIDAYLNLGLVGVALIALILLSGYVRANGAFLRDREIGGLSLAFLATCAVYSVTEAGFRILTPSWMFLLIAVVSAGGLSKGGIRMYAAELLPSRRSRPKIPGQAWNNPQGFKHAHVSEISEQGQVERQALNGTSGRFV